VDLNELYVIQQKNGRGALRPAGGREEKKKKKQQEKLLLLLLRAFPDNVRDAGLFPRRGFHEERRVAVAAVGARAPRCESVALVDEDVLARATQREGGAAEAVGYFAGAVEVGHRFRSFPARRWLAHHEFSLGLHSREVEAHPTVRRADSHRQLVVDETHVACTKKRKRATGTVICKV
jgi:hypothetical protein